MIYKCKMCGGSLDIAEGATTCECEYCETVQTVPVIDNEKKLNLFNRANRLRMASEFDKAAGVYESIVSEFPEEAEGYWGLCLCKFGIEYVDDPATGKKIPTCHRTMFESIFDDNDFDMACEYADAYSKRLYREEAKEIDRLQRAVLDIVKTEEPYDIFICYKETDESGQRTKDSVLAQDMYDALTAKGYKVFFARISLEDKLGQEYEPYIFAALTSAKVMLAVGTDYEYFNAVWVKNEWSRYLALMKKDKAKTLIPCYADIDAYDMPQEFKHLQAQDMNKIGFMQDLVRGIGKLIPLESDKTVDTQSVQPVQQVQTIVRSTNVENLIKRGNMAIEDGAFEDAKKHFEKVLDEDAECGQAYWGMFLAAQECKTDDIAQKLHDNTDLFADKDLVKAVQFSDETLLTKMKGCFEEAVKIEEKAFNNEKENAYQKCVQYIENGYVNTEILNLLKQFNGYKNSDAYIIKAEELKRLTERNNEIGNLNSKRLQLLKMLDEHKKNKVISEEIVLLEKKKEKAEIEKKNKKAQYDELIKQCNSIKKFLFRQNEVDTKLSELSREIGIIHREISEFDEQLNEKKSIIKRSLSYSEIEKITNEIAQIDARLAELNS